MIEIKEIKTFCQLGPRDNQEDCIMPKEPTTSNRVLVLCDGMGGHGHGEVASRIVAETVYDYLTGLDADEYTGADIQAAVDCASEALCAGKIADEERVMGTTLAVAVMNRNCLMAGHVGDSRVYLFGRDGRIKFRTTDHSLVAEAVANEIITEDEAFDNPYKNRITRALMADKAHAEAEIDVVNVCDGDILMLCSDGVNDCLRDSRLEEAFTAFDFADGADAIRRQCEVASGDNNTALIALLGQDEVGELEVQEAELEMPGKLCPGCGAAIVADAKFCPMCGWELDGIITDDLKTEPERGGNLFKKFIGAFRRKI